MPYTPNQQLLTDVKFPTPFSRSLIWSCSSVINFVQEYMRCNIVVKHRFLHNIYCE